MFVPNEHAGVREVVQPLGVSMARDLMGCWVRGELHVRCRMHTQRAKQGRAARSLLVRMAGDCSTASWHGRCLRENRTTRRWSAGDDEPLNAGFSSTLPARENAHGVRAASGLAQGPADLVEH